MKKKKKTKGKHHDQISIDEFNTSDDDILNHSLYCYALNRYKEATGDKEAHLRDVIDGLKICLLHKGIKPILCNLTYLVIIVREHRVYFL